MDPATGAVTPPIYLSTTFERDAHASYPRGYEYARESNPNREALEECLRELEGGAAAAAFSSGMAATMTVLQTLAPGDHVVAPDDTYFGTREIFRDLFSGWGVETSFVDMTNVEEVGEAGCFFVNPGVYEMSSRSRCVESIMLHASGSMAV